MSTSSSAIKYGNALCIPRSEIARATLLFDPLLNGSGGIDTNGLIRKYPDECRKDIGTWLAQYDHDHKPTGPVLVQTFRNLIQNPRCIAYTRELGICQSADEHALESERSFYGISFLSDGSLRADSIIPSNGFASDIEQFGAGIPVLWNGRLLSLDEIVSEVSDFAHVWNMRVSSSGSVASDANRFSRLQAVFETVRRASANVAAAAILEEARGDYENNTPLNREHGYLHNVLGVRPDGGVVIVLAHGSLEELGEAAQQAGAYSAVIVDNGGSCALALRQEPESELRTLIESYYHRSRAVAVAVYELAPAEQRRHLFTNVPMPWSAPGQHQSVLALRNPRYQVEIQYTTNLGIVRRQIVVENFNSAAARVVALSIGNFAVVHGALSAQVSAPEDFVQQVQSKFREHYRATRRSLDPTMKYGLWLEYYLEGVNEQMFLIKPVGAGTTSSSAAAVPRRLSGSVADCALGIDIGAETIKIVLLQSGSSVVAEDDIPTREDGRDYLSDTLKQQIQQGVKSVMEIANTPLDRIHEVGICWPGAVRNGLAAPSKTLLDMVDVSRDRTHLNIELFDQIRNLSSFLRNVLNLRLDQSIHVFNDGEVEVLHETYRSDRRGVLLCKIGTTVAGGFVDNEGNSSFLTELGRCVIRTDAEAPRHKWSHIRGVASHLVGSVALKAACDKCGLVAVNGNPVSVKKVGHELCQIIHEGGSRATLARQLVEEMGVWTAVLLEECVYQLPPVSYILLRGGLAGEHPVGRILRDSVKRNLPRDLADRIVPEQPSRHSGAFAAGWLAARM